MAPQFFLHSLSQCRGFVEQKPIKTQSKDPSKIHIKFEKTFWNFENADWKAVFDTKDGADTSKDGPNLVTLPDGPLISPRLEDILVND
ncbi:hypothetical protein HK097_003192 [Rhizophlyctis rosea]|uniref:Uncharacterized protein n=1 Tax=Rhizophlyctis rosea TaxID=64517 RepID=A0AAD5S2L4_9FUNG|nr:hypothetical protein HK097_003192 [Rhizophlyctis rosea]